MSKPSATEIEKEIKVLQGYVDRVRPTSAFGDDNVEAIETQIRVLDELLTDDDVYDLFEVEEEISEYAKNCGLDAVAWLEGDNDEPPSKDWEGLLEVQ